MHMHAHKHTTRMARHDTTCTQGIFVVCLVCCGLMFGVTLSANEASKENHVSSDGTLVGLNGAAVGVTQVMSQASLYDMVGFGHSVLGSLDHVELAVDMTSDANIQKNVAMVVKIASVWKPEGVCSCRAALLFVCATPSHALPVMTRRHR